MPKNFIDPELGPMRHCHICKEDWPATTEFFYSAGSRGLADRCRACYEEWRAARRKQTKEEAYARLAP